MARDFFTVSDPPYMRGRVAGRRALAEPDYSKVQQFPQKNPEEDKKAVMEVLLRAVLKEADLPEIPSQCEKLPFESAKKIEALRAVELYLSSQLVQVRKEIQRVTQESVQEKEDSNV